VCFLAIQASIEIVRNYGLSKARHSIGFQYSRYDMLYKAQPSQELHHHPLTSLYADDSASSSYLHCLASVLFVFAIKASIEIALLCLIANSTLNGGMLKDHFSLILF